MIDQVWLKRLTRLPLLLAMIAAPAGCSPANQSAQRDSMGEYQAANYSQALDKARKEADQLTGADRQRARYVAGMSAYQLKKDEEALRFLTAVAGEEDPAIAGPAAATVGLIHVRTGYHAKALPYFLQAAKLLKGEDQAQALYHMGAAEQRLGHWPDARVHLEQALNSTAKLDLRDAIRKRLTTTGFTIQLGVYSEKKNADQQAMKAQPAAQKAGLGTPRVVTGAASGKTMFYVQLGQYPTYDAAMKARQSLGRIDALVTELKTPETK